MNAKTFIIAALLIVLATPSALIEQTHAQVREKGDLRWELDSNLYLHYAVDSQVALGSEEDPKPNLQYVHFMGYELDQNGRATELTRPWVIEEILFQLAGYVPATAQRAEDVWENFWVFDSVSGTQALDVTSRWEFKERAKYGKHDCARILGTHKLTHPMPDASARWTKFEVTTESWFDDKAHLLQGFSVNMRAAKQEPNTEVEGESIARNYAWDVTYKLQQTIDSAEAEALKKKVDIAIVKGVERLWAQRNKDGHWPHGGHVRGGTSMALLALRRAGLEPGAISEGLGPRWEPVVESRRTNGAGLRAAYLLRAERRSLPLTPVRSRRSIPVAQGAAAAAT